MIVLRLSNLGFLFLSRCLIFKVQSLSSQLSRLEDSSKSISHQISSCQYFLQSFFNFFVLTFSLPTDISAGKLVYIITSFSFCQLFFETFFNIFHNSFCFCTLFRVNLVLFYKNTTKYSVPLCGVLVTTIYGGITESIYKSKIPPRNSASQRYFSVNLYGSQIESLRFLLQSSEIHFRLDFSECMSA